MFISKGVCVVLGARIRVEAASIGYVRGGCFCQIFSRPKPCVTEWLQLVLRQAIPFVFFRQAPRSPRSTFCLQQRSRSLSPEHVLAEHDVATYMEFRVVQRACMVISIGLSVVLRAQIRVEVFARSSVCTVVKVLCRLVRLAALK